MLFSTALDYTCGQIVECHRGQRGAKIALLVSVCVNLGLLGVFKYSDFLIGTVNSLFGTALPPAESAAAHRHQLLYVPDHELHH